jgi:hypothetical protein
MQIAAFHLALPELRRLRPPRLLIGAGAVLLSPLSWLVTSGAPHLPAAGVYLAGGIFVAAGLALAVLERRHAPPG